MLFLGTGADDWDVTAKTNFFRRNSAALLNNELMLDCGPHTIDFLIEYKKPALYDGVTE